MPYILAGQTELKKNEWGGGVNIADEHWEHNNGRNIAYYFKKGFNLYRPPTEKHELTLEQQQQIPKKVLFNYPKKGMWDISGTGAGTLLFSQRVKDKLEELEPGAHDYFPVTLEHPKTGEQVTGHYLTYVWQRPDIIDHGKCLISGPKIETGLEWAKSRGFRPHRFFETGISDINKAFRYLINFKAPGYKGHHLWRGTVGTENVPEQYDGKTSERLYPDNLAGMIFVSDEFADWMTKEKITGTRPIPILEESVDWYKMQKEKGIFA